LGKEFNNKIIFGLAFHLKSLIERVKKKEPIVNHELSKIKEIYINEYEVASAVVKKIEERFDLQIPVDENGFIAILLANNEVESADEDKIGILIITHGNSTATSMARVCNRLLNSNFVKAIDMPLEKEVSEIYQKTLVTVKSIDRGKGVIILVDMGSLKEFGEKITEETGIITRTIDRVSTPLVLEVLRRVMYKKESIDKIYESFKNDSKDSIEEITYKKEKAIMTVCTTGKGTSIMLQNILSNILQESGNDDINIIPINYTAIESNSKEYKNMQQKYDFIACVGNIKPEIDIPFFSVEDIVNEQSRYKFNRFVESKVKIKEVEDKKSSYDTAKKMLEEFTLYINPKKAVNFIEKFIESLDFQELNNDDTLKTNLTVHLGFMIERVITCKRAVFEELDIFKSKHKSQFERIRKSIKILEDPYKIKIGDNEICYILQVINGRHQKT
jgi:transcriptional regulatory protein LevR